MSAITRRTLLASATSIFLPHSAHSNSFDFQGKPLTNRTGRINLGLNGLTHYMAFYSFINAWKTGAPIQVICKGISYWSNSPPGSRESAWGTFLDQDGELVNPLPDDTSRVERMFYAPSQDGLPDGYSRRGQRWVLKWDGSVRNVSIVPAMSQTRIGNRLEWVWDADEGPRQVVFNDIDIHDPPRNVRLCEARHEALLEMGDAFNPDWLDRVREGAGIVRFMDWQSTNGNLSTLRFSDIPNERYFAYGGDTRTPLIRGGIPTSVMSGLANKVHSHPWVCIPHCFGTKRLTAINGITKASSTVVSSPGHSWPNGEKVLIYRVNGMTELNENVYTVCNSNPQGGTLELNGVNSLNFSAYTSSGYLASPINLDATSAEIVRLAAHFRDHIDTDLITYFELSNETWNTLFDQFYWFSAQGTQFFGHQGRGIEMSGYIAAHCMKVIRDTYGVANRHRWRGVLPTQTGNIRVTKRYLNGIQQYITRHCPTLATKDLFDDIAVTGYFGDLLTNYNKSTVFRWMDLSERRWQAGTEPTKHSYFNRVVNEDIADARHTGMDYSVSKLPSYWRMHKIVAESEGLGFVQYEGGNGNSPDFSPALNGEERARFMEFYKKCNHTLEDAANYAKMFTDFAEIGGSYPSKFVEARPVVYFGAWGGLRYLGDSNPVWDTVVRFNGRA